jgi:DNA helicase HerA-like ATPase
LRVLDWSLWARGGTAAEDVVAGRPDAVVLELSGFAYPDEARVAALCVLDHLWAHRHERNPVLIVIDEAHNFCVPDPVTPLIAALTERISQIAAEGRKYGLWLLLSTQRPSKIHSNVISQCDNLALTKMSSPRDLVELRRLRLRLTGPDRAISPLRAGRRPVRGRVHRLARDRACASASHL